MSKATWCHNLTKFSALQVRKAEGRAGQQATQFTAALMDVVMVKVILTLMMIIVMMLFGNANSRREGWATQFTAALMDVLIVVVMVTG